MSTAIDLPQSNIGWFKQIDDWLKRDRFVFTGWSRLLLFTFLSGTRVASNVGE